MDTELRNEGFVIDKKGLKKKKPFSAVQAAVGRDLYENKRQDVKEKSQEAKQHASKVVQQKQATIKQLEKQKKILAQELQKIDQTVTQQEQQEKEKQQKFAQKKAQKKARKEAQKKKERKEKLKEQRVKEQQKKEKAEEQRKIQEEEWKAEQEALEELSEPEIEIQDSDEEIEDFLDSTSRTQGLRRQEIYGNNDQEKENQLVEELFGREFVPDEYKPPVILGEDILELKKSGDEKKVATKKRGNDGMLITASAHVFSLTHLFYSEIQSVAETSGAAWEDEDDAKIKIALKTQKRTKKLRTTHEENKISGEDYVNRLRARYFCT